MASRIQITTDKMYKQICDRLTKERQFISTMEKLKSCESDQQRLEFVVSLPVVQEMVSKSLNAKDSKEKDNICSVAKRKEGNTHFQSKKYDTALELYTESVLQAEVGKHKYTDEFINEAGKADNKEWDSTLATAYANRSAANFHLGRYDACLVDIDLALRCGYAKENEHKLYERQGKCYFQLRQKTKALASFRKAINATEYLQEDKKREKMIDNYKKEVDKCEKLIGDGVEKMPTLMTVNDFHSSIPEIKPEERSDIFLSSTKAVGLRESAEMGRGLVATRNVEVGEILIVEKPYSSIVLKTMEKTYCHHCCNRVICPVPCCKCSHVVYCSLGCQRESWDGYHRFECSILFTVQDADIKLGHLALRMVIKAGFPYLMLNRNELLANESSQNIGYGRDGKYHSDDYIAVHDLVKHSELRTPEDVFQRSVRAMFLLKCLELTPFFSEEECSVSEKDRLFVGSQILRHLQMLPCNAHEVSELKWKPGSTLESETLEVGSAIYATLSLINHSCDPSVVRHSYRDMCVVRAIKQIPAGEEILDNYGALYPLTIREERRAILKPQYYFDCNCEACQLDLPTYFEIPSSDPVYKCENCNGPIFVAPANMKFTCSSCKQEQDLSEKIKKLKSLEEKYKDALEQVLNGQNLDESLTSLLAYMSLCNSTVCLPWRDFNNCQEGVKQCFAVKANCFTVT